MKFTDVDECKNTPCKNGAECQNNEGSFMCQCKEGWTGQHCDEGLLLITFPPVSFTSYTFLIKCFQKVLLRNVEEFFLFEVLILFSFHCILKILLKNKCWIAGKFAVEFFKKMVRFAAIEFVIKTFHIKSFYLPAYLF